jgi:hypothetical protein
VGEEAAPGIGTPLSTSDRALMAARLPDTSVIIDAIRDRNFSTEGSGSFRSALSQAPRSVAEDAGSLKSRHLRQVLQKNSLKNTGQVGPAQQNSTRLDAGAE